MVRVTATLMSPKHSRLTDNLARAWGVMYQRLVPPCSFEGVALSAPHSIVDFRNINTTYCYSAFPCFMVL